MAESECIDYFNLPPITKYCTAMIPRMTIIIQADSVVSDTNGSISFGHQSLATRGERHSVVY